MDLKWLNIKNYAESTSLDLREWLFELQIRLSLYYDYSAFEFVKISFQKLDERIEHYGEQNTEVSNCRIFFKGLVKDNVKKAMLHGGSFCMKINNKDIHYKDALELFIGDDGDFSVFRVQIQ